MAGPFVTLEGTDGEPVLVRVEAIIAMERPEDERTVLHLGNGFAIDVIESPEAIFNKIAAGGFDRPHVIT